MTPRNVSRALAALSVAFMLTGTGCTAPESHNKVKAGTPNNVDPTRPDPAPVARKIVVEPKQERPAVVDARRAMIPVKSQEAAQPKATPGPAKVAEEPKERETAPVALAKADVVPPLPVAAVDSRRDVHVAVLAPPAPVPAPVAAPITAPATATVATPATAPIAIAQNPYLVPQQVGNPVKEWSDMIGDVKRKLNFDQPRQDGVANGKGEGQFGPLKLPEISQLIPGDIFLLPKIKTVYPTGEKPLVIVTFKCPTEIIGITPLPTKALHDVVTWGMDSINNANLLDFNMQQVCQ